jgi:hypothetical protein
VYELFYDNPSKRARDNHKIIHTHDITEKLIEETFVSSKKNMLAFSTKEEAATTMALSLKVANTTPDFIDGNIPYFAVPIVFVVEIEDDYPLNESTNISATMIYKYFETKSIPYFWGENAFHFYGDKIMWIKNEIERINNNINKVELDTGRSLKTFSIEKSAICKKVQAYYMAANPCREVLVNLSTAAKDLKNIRAGKKGSSVIARYKQLSLLL